ncbi:NADH-quinone oxidoreductase subunit G [Streptomyces sp. YIM 98790]|uniref:NADH-quinone oxidoreductase subunit G n=1 Tax=Streptomyces sp. YIM 98790 TaxID=2689077 RepID=UPI00140DE512|nr:NADH-quinone oxidoreductase subunit G [Streptomyces sp. YIM 98790]
MTVTTDAKSPTPGDGGAGAGRKETPPPELVTLTIDGVEISVPKGTLVIRAAEQLGIEVPRFCDHPLLDPVGACRQCMVEVEGQRKPMASCTITCTDGMVVRTQLTSPGAAKAQHGVMELLLINHPLDCPVCDKGGECPLQNQAMSHGNAESRFDGKKRTFDKPVPVSPNVLLDRERCVLCARCTRFSHQIAGDPMIELLERGALQQVGTGAGQPLESYFSGNTIQICPVGALTSASYRFRARPFDLVSSPSVCEHCAGGCATRTDHRRGKVMRRLAGNDPEVNEEWMCDKGRFAFRYAQLPDRLGHPLVRNPGTGELEPASWPEALHAAAEGLRRARDNGDGAAVLPGGRLTVEDAYAYAKFARVALGTNDIDFRARPHSAEETDFLAAHVAGTGLHGLNGTAGTGVTHRALENAPAVLLAGFESEEEAPGVFLRLRKGSRRHGLEVFSLATHTTPGLAKTNGTLLPAAPGTEPEWLDALAAGEGGPLGDDGRRAAEALRQDGAVIIVGERLATVPGGLTAAVGLAGATGAALAWIPRRAGERGAVEAGALPGLLPGGRPDHAIRAREEVAEVWGVSEPELPDRPGRDTSQIIEAAASGRLGALVVGGVQTADLPDPRRALAALDRMRDEGFLVSLELRPSEVTARAHVVLPVAAVAEKSGTFLNWEGRYRPFEAAIKPDQMTRRHVQTDTRALHMLADHMDVALGLPDVTAVRRELAELGEWTGDLPLGPTGTADTPALPEPGTAVLAGHRMLLDQGRLQDGDEALAATRHAAPARLSAATATAAGLAADAAAVTVTGPAGSMTLPLEITEMPDGVVWLPLNSTGGGVHHDLGAVPGQRVTLAAAPAVSGEAQEKGGEAR